MGYYHSVVGHISPGQEGPFTCHVCRINFDTFRGLQIHAVQRHTGTEQKWVKTSSSARKPLSHENANGKLQQKTICDICGSSLHPGSYKRHMASHKSDDNQPKKCTYCEEEFPTYAKMTRHRKWAHAEKYKVDRDKLMREEGSKKLGKVNSCKQKTICDICGSSLWPGNYKKHMAAHKSDDNKPKNCTYCEKEFPHYVNMIRHRKLAHAEQYKVDRDKLMREEGSAYVGKVHPSKKYYQKAVCTTCGKTLCSRQQLHLHMKALHGTGLPRLIRQGGKGKPT